MKQALLSALLAISIYDLPHAPDKVAVVIEDGPQKTTVIVKKADLDKPETLDRLEGIANGNYRAKD